MSSGNTAFSGVGQLASNGLARLRVAEHPLHSGLNALRLNSPRGPAKSRRGLRTRLQ